MKIFKNKAFLDAVFFLALLFKLFSYGACYFPVLDDYIQYGGYPLYENLSHVYLNIGTIATRPFAAFLDPLFWGSFFPHMQFALFIIAVASFTGAKLITKAFERMGIFVTTFVYTILLLCPLGFEGTYWISASSRICVGLLFTGLALYFLIKVIDKKSKSWLIPYILCCVLSFGFYESVMILSALLQVILIMTLVKNKKKWYKYLATPVICAVLMLAYYKVAGNIGALGSRLNTVAIENMGQKSKELFSQLYEIFVVGTYKTVFLGAYHGFLLVLSDRTGIVMLAIAVLIAFLCAYFGKNADLKAKWTICVPFGFLLVLLPLVPNVLSGEVWLTYRSIVPCFLGIVLITAPIAAPLLKKKSVRAVVIFLTVLLFLSGNVNELDTYKRVYETDNLLIEKVCQKLDGDVLSGKRNAVVVLDEEVKVAQTSYYKDHVKSVFSSDWALTGAVRAKCRNINIKNVTPVFANEKVTDKTAQIIYIGGSYDW